MQSDVLRESSGSQKKVISVLYRIILIVYSAALLLYFEHTFPWFYTIIYFVLYLVFYIILYGKDKIYAILRLSNDYLFIALTIYSLGFLDLYTFGLLFLPILNSQNHTGSKKSILLYIFPVAIIFYIDNKADFFKIVPFAVFYIINSFEKIKNKYQTFYNELNASLDGFVVEENSLNNLHKIYDEIIPIFNNHSFFSRDIKHIVCFKKHKDSIIVVNGSMFIFEYKFEDLKAIFQDKKNLLKNRKVILNSEEFNENVLLKITRNTTDYLFLLIPEKSEKITLNVDKFYYKLLRPFFYRLSNILNFKNIQLEDSRRNFYSIAKRVTYVNNAINSMHFTRNKLSPLKNYLAMIDDYDKETSIDRKNLIEPYLRDERKKVKTSLDLILGRADIILEKENNPFNVLQSSEHSFFAVLVKVRDAVSYYLDVDKFEFDLGNFSFRNNSKINFNETGLDLILSNWFSNVNKYKADDNYGAIVSEEDDTYIITFFNKFNKKGPKEIPDFVEDFNSNDRMAILKRNTRGLIEIKDFLEQMGINGEMYAKADKLYFKMQFSKIL